MSKTSNLYSIRSRTKTFFLRVEGNKWREVKGYPITLQDFENVDLFIHYERDSRSGDKMWSLYEAKSGLRATVKSKNKDFLLTEAHRVLMELEKDEDKEGIREAIEEKVKYFGCSPLYELEPEAKEAILRATDKVKSYVEKLDKGLVFKEIESTVNTDIRGTGKVELVIRVMFGPKEENSV